MRNCDSKWIDVNTFVVQPVFEGPMKTHIITKNGAFTSKKPQLELLDLACMRYFSTYEGRIRASRWHTNYQKKTPLCIAENLIEAFPTRSPSHPECMWIFNHYFEIIPYTSKQSILAFLTGPEVLVNASRHTIEKQQSRMIMMMHKRNELVKNK